MRITWIRSNTNAVGEYRARHPALALRELGHDTSVITLSETPERVSAAEIAGDVLVLQRQTHSSVLDLVDRIPADLRPVLVYEMDDNPWEMHSWDPIHRRLGSEYGRRCRAVMARCAAVTCTTRTLAARVRQELPEMPVWVIPNAIDYHLRDWQTREDRAALGLADRTVLGWTGSCHHGRDGGAMLQALPEVFSRYPEAVLVMQCDPSVYQSWTTTLREGWGDRLRWVCPVAFGEHPRIYSLFDVSLAPLETTPFNSCKSDLKLIEAGAWGVPYVASAIAPYVEFHEHSGAIGGYLARRPGEWLEAICHLLDREDVARGESLARYVRATRSLAVVAGQWEAAFRAILAGAAGEPIAARPRPGRNDLCPCGSGTKYKRCHEPAYG